MLLAKQRPELVVDQHYSRYASSVLCVAGLGSSAIDVAASPPTVGLGPELAFQLHEAPDLSAVGTEVGLDLGGQLAHGFQVDPEQLCAPLQRRRDRPAQSGSCQVPTEPGYRTGSKVNRERCVVRRTPAQPGWAALGPQLSGTWGAATDSRRQQT